MLGRNQPNGPYSSPLSCRIFLPVRLTGLSTAARAGFLFSFRFARGIRGPFHRNRYRDRSDEFDECHRPRTNEANLRRKMTPAATTTAATINNASKVPL